MSFGGSKPYSNYGTCLLTSHSSEEDLGREEQFWDWNVLEKPVWNLVIGQGQPLEHQKYWLFSPSVRALAEGRCTFKLDEVCFIKGLFPKAWAEVRETKQVVCSSMSGVTAVQSCYQPWV